MTDRDKRIEAALAALDKATPGEWIFNGSDIYSTDPNVNFGAICYGDGQLGYAVDGNTAAADADTKLLVASKDLAAEVVRLRKWQSEAMKLIDGCLAMPSELADRLIAEAEGE